jgi:hypothetical protein
MTEEFHEMELLGRVVAAGDAGLIGREIHQSARAGDALRLGSSGYRIARASFEVLQAMAERPDPLVRIEQVNAVYAGRGSATIVRFVATERGHLALAAARAGTAA